MFFVVVLIFIVYIFKYLFICCCLKIYILNRFLVSELLTSTVPSFSNLLDRLGVAGAVLQTAL